MRTTYCFLGLRDIPPLEETRHKMMTYLLDRHDNSRDKRFTPYYDVVFVLDSSESISRADFNVSVSVAKSLVTRFEPDSPFAAITFGTNASVSFNFKSPKVSKRINTGTVLMAKGRQL